MHPNTILTTIPKRITRQHISALHTHYLATSSHFSSYNFREYFLRWSHEKFHSELPSLHSLCAQESNDQASQHALQKWWKETVEDLRVMERASVLNRLYEAPKLVVEGPRNFTATTSDGVGIENSTGGAGQPDRVGDNIKTPAPHLIPSSSSSS